MTAMSGNRGSAVRRGDRGLKQLFLEATDLSTVRIYKVAELLNTTSQEVMALLKRDHGIEVKSASSTIEEVVARQFVERLARQRQRPAPARPGCSVEAPAPSKRRKKAGRGARARAAAKADADTGSASPGEDDRRVRAGDPAAPGATPSGRRRVPMTYYDSEPEEMPEHVTAAASIGGRRSAPAFTDTRSSTSASAVAEPPAEDYDEPAVQARTRARGAARRGRRRPSR